MQLNILQCTGQAPAPRTHTETDPAPGVREAASEDPAVMSGGSDSLHGSWIPQGSSRENQGALRLLRPPSLRGHGAPLPGTPLVQAVPNLPRLQGRSRAWTPPLRGRNVGNLWSLKPQNV